MGLKDESRLCGFASALATRRGKTELRIHKPGCYRDSTSSSLSVVLGRIYVFWPPFRKWVLTTTTPPLKKVLSREEGGFAGLYI